MIKIRTNKIKEKILSGERVFGCSFRFSSLQIVEMVGILGFDYIFIDGEHGAFSLADIEQMCIVADGMGLTTIARVPNIHPSTILRFLDRGVMGILGPHISTKTEAESLVKSCKYPPEGIRSFAGDRIYNYETPINDAKSYISQANDVLIIALIEDTQGVENLSKILTVKGLDVICFGAFDLSFSLGFPGNLEHPKIVDAIEKGVDQIRASGKIYNNDYLISIGVNELLMSAGREFLRS